MKLLRVVVLAGLLWVLVPAGPASAFAQPVDCLGTMLRGAGSFGGGAGFPYPADYSIALPTWYKWEPGDYIRIYSQRPTGTTLEIWLDDELVASGPYPELTYTVAKRQIAYLTVVLNSQQAESISYSLLVSCPA